MLKLILHAKNESSRFYRPFLPVQISIVCGSSTTINSTCWETSEDLSLRPGGGGTPIYGLYRYVPRNRVWFLRFSVLK